MRLLVPCVFWLKHNFVTESNWDKRESLTSHWFAPKHWRCGITGDPNNCQNSIEMGMEPEIGTMIEGVGDEVVHGLGIFLVIVIPMLIAYFNR